jgi:pimeloyl-ACP methyl ester carboxylesterase
MLDDVDAIFEAAGAPAHKTIAFGRSIGSIYAIELARRTGCAGLILESGIHSVLERILLRAHPAELGTTMEALQDEAHRLFDHAAKLRAYQGELLVLHALYDSLVSIDHARANFEASEHPQKQCVEFARGDHNSVFWDNRSEYIASLKTFLQKFA